MTTGNPAAATSTHAGPSATHRDPTGNPTLRLNSLTSMRFFAAMIVVFYHAFSSFTGDTEIGYLKFGYLGVGFFFVLSGVVLAWSWRPGTSVATQWRRRLSRIVPLYWLLNLVAAAIYFSFPASAPAAVQPTGRGLAVVMLFGQAWPPFRHILDFNYPSWSLSTELFFYALFPFVILLLHRRSARTLLTTGGLLLAAYLVVIPLLWLHPIPTLYPGNMLAFPPLQMLKFTVGVCLGLALRKGWRPTLQPGTALALLIGAAALVPALSTSWTRATAFRASEIFPDMLVTIPVVLLIIAAAAADLRGQRGVGSSRVLVRLGDWSFAMYLVHAPLLLALNAFRIATGSVTPPGLGWLAVYVAVVILLAGVLHHGFELPLERLLRGRRRRPSITDD